MDPVGKQSKIPSNEYRKTFEKKLSGGGAKSNYDGISFPSSTRKASASDSKWQGKVRGATKHTYGVNGENDPD